MAATFFLRSLTSTLGGAGQLCMSQKRGRASTTAVTTTTAGGTNIPVTTSAGGQALTWFSEPVTEAITISGTVTVNVRGLESANTVNAGAGILIERTNNAGTVQSTIVAVTGIPATITEFGTTDAAKTGTYTATSTAMAVGERIKVTLSIRNVGTMAAGTATVSYNGAASAAAGDTYVTFTQDVRTDEQMDVPTYEIMGMNGYYG